MKYYCSLCGNDGFELKAETGNVKSEKEIIAVCGSCSSESHIKAKKGRMEIKPSPYDGGLNGRDEYENHKSSYLDDGWDGEEDEGEPAYLFPERDL